MTLDTTPAACHGTDVALFYGTDDEPRHHRVTRERAAKTLCARCPIRTECLTLGATEPYGIWGGLTAKERQRANRPTKTIVRDIPAEKTCSDCGETKPATEFHPCKTTTDGLYNKCKPCKRADNRRSEAVRRNREKLDMFRDFDELTRTHNVYPPIAARRVGVTIHTINRYRQELAGQLEAAS